MMQQVCCEPSANLYSMQKFMNPNKEGNMVMQTIFPFLSAMRFHKLGKENKDECKYCII